MNGSRRKRPPELLFLLSALIAIFLFSGTVRAGEKLPTYVDEYGIRVCGEPGEDPHLRVKEDIQFMDECATVTFPEGRDGPNPLDPYGGGAPDGKALLTAGWRILLRMMLDTIPR